MSITTDEHPAPPPPASHGDAGQDRDITERLDRDPDDEQARLDEALDETMDGSDPVAMLQPGSSDRSNQNGSGSVGRREP